MLSGSIHMLQVLMPCGLPAHAAVQAGFTERVADLHYGDTGCVGSQLLQVHPGSAFVRLQQPHNHAPMPLGHLNHLQGTGRAAAQG